MPHAATTTTTAAPLAKLVDLGDTFVGAWAGSIRRQARDFATRDPLFRRDDPSRQVLEEINWFIAMPGTTAKLGTAEDGYETIEAGAEVRFLFSGFKWGQAIEQRKALPAVAEFNIGKGREASSDVYTIRLVGWSSATENPEAARKAGFTVVEKRIVMTTDDEHEQWVLARVKQGANTNAARDFQVTIRRADFTAEHEWVKLADALWERKPWEQQAAAPAESVEVQHPVEVGDELPEEPF